MSIGKDGLSVRGVDVDVVYKDIKNLHIGVYPPWGRVRVAAPLAFDEDRVRLAVLAHWTWVTRQRDELRAADRASEPEMIAGESHYVWGRRRRLKVVERAGRAHIEVDGERLVLYVPGATEAVERRRILEQWHRAQLREHVPELLGRWTAELGREPSRWGLRRMKTRWGSCNPETGALWFNPELATKHPDGLEYVVVHELAHLVERSHGSRFTSLMDRHLPDWRRRRRHLNDAPLGHEEWPQ